MNDEASLVHRVREPAGEAEGALILLHGRGTDETDLYPLLDELDPERRLVGITPGGPLTDQPPGGRHWYIVERVGQPDEETFNAATDGLAEAIDAAWTAGAVEECNRLEVLLWLDGPAGPEGRVSGPPRALALDMNRIVIANGESDFDGASGLDTASRVHEIAVPAIVACSELDVAIKVRRSAELADAIPNATYRSLPGRAHLPYLEATEEIAALITDEIVAPL